MNIELVEKKKTKNLWDINRLRNFSKTFFTTLPSNNYLSNFGRKKESKIALSPILVTLIVSLS
jgi:hypothetical protein